MYWLLLDQQLIESEVKIIIIVDLDALKILFQDE